MHRGNLARQFKDRRDQPVRLDVESGQPADLAHEDRQGNAREEADQDRPRQESGKHAEPQRPRAEIHPAHHESQHRRGSDAVDRSKPRRQRQHRRHHRYGCGVRADDELP